MRRLRASRILKSLNKPPCPPRPSLWTWFEAMGKGPTQAEQAEEAFLREEWNLGKSDWLRSAVERSNLSPAVKRVIGDLVDGTLKRKPHKPRDEDTDLRNMARALKVLDLERERYPIRESALHQATIELGCKKRTLEKALEEYEVLLLSANPDFLDRLRSAT
jgi:hypothetical protein